MNWQYASGINRFHAPTTYQPSIGNFQGQIAGPNPISVMYLFFDKAYFCLFYRSVDKTRASQVQHREPLADYPMLHSFRRANFMLPTWRMLAARNLDRAANFTMPHFPTCQLVEVVVVTIPLGEDRYNFKEGFPLGHLPNHP